jgi:hypothetical protein
MTTACLFRSSSQVWLFRKRRSGFRRPSSTPMLGLEMGAHVRCKRRLGFYPTQEPHLRALARALGTLTHNRVLCDPACGPTRRIADLLRVFQPKRILCFDAQPLDCAVNFGDLTDAKWCHRTLGPVYTIITSLPYGSSTVKTTMLRNLVSLLHSDKCETHCVAVKMLSNYDSYRLDGRNEFLGEVALEVKLPPVKYPGYSSAFPWPEAWFVFQRHHTPLNARRVIR